MNQVSNHRKWESGFVLPLPVQAEVTAQEFSISNGVGGPIDYRFSFKVGDEWQLFDAGTVPMWVPDFKRSWTDVPGNMGQPNQEFKIEIIMPPRAGITGSGGAKLGEMVGRVPVA